MLDSTVLSVDPGRIRYILKECIGKVAAKVESFRQCGRSQEAPSQVTQPHIAGGDKLQHVTRRGQPEAAEPEECENDIIKKYREEVLRGCRPVGQISGLSQPMETLRLHPDMFIDADRGWPLSEPLVGEFEELGADVVVIEEDAGFPQERWETRDRKSVV